MMKSLLKLLIFLLLVSCSSTKVIELGGKAANKGTDVSQNALDLYSTLQQQADIEKSLRDKCDILANPDPTSMTLPDNKIKDFTKQIAPRIKAYQSLLNTYRAFALLTDSKYGDKTKEATSALKDAYNAIEKLPDIPSAISAKLPDVLKMVTQEIQAKKIKEHNNILYELTKIYILLWDEDQKIWNDYIDMVYNQYANCLNSVNSKKYDVKKIADLDNEPYSDDATIILMYRLKNRNDIFKQRDAIKEQLIDFGKALSELNKAHSEIAKQKTDISEVISILNSIENLLKQK